MNIYTTLDGLYRGGSLGEKGTYTGATYAGIYTVCMEWRCAEDRRHEDLYPRELSPEK